MAFTAATLVPTDSSETSDPLLDGTDTKACEVAVYRRGWLAA